MKNPFDLIDRRLENLESLILDLKHKPQEKTENPTPENPIDEYIPKTEVRGKLAANSTLWKLEKEKRLTVYAIGGKRYYKRKDIEDLFKPLNK